MRATHFENHGGKQPTQCAAGTGAVLVVVLAAVTVAVAGGRSSRRCGSGIGRDDDPREPDVDRHGRVCLSPVTEVKQLFFFFFVGVLGC